MSLIFLRLEFFSEWAKLFRRIISHTRYRHKARTLSSSSSRKDYLVHLHTPSKDFANINTMSLETPYRSHGFELPILPFDLHPPLHAQSESESSIFSEPPRPGSGRPSSSRPTSQRSTTVLKKDRSKKVNVEDILAMRRMEQGNEQGDRQYPGIQPTKLSRTAGNGEEAWPTFRFGE